MRIHRPTAIAGCLLIALTAPTTARARADLAPRYPYTLVDPGTFGGPQSFANLPGVPLTPQGALIGTADTATPSPSFPDNNPFIVGSDPFTARAFAWRDGRLRYLGALPGGGGSAVFEVDDSGVGVGASETAIHDPFTGWPAEHAVTFNDGQVLDLGTLPGGYESQAMGIDDRGDVAGFASNSVPDGFTSAFFGPGWTTQVRSFIWQRGRMGDLGTLGGPDAPMTAMNARGQVLGESYTDSTPTATFGVPTLHPYLWQRGRMQDIGTLGGTFVMANSLNNAGDVVGFSFLADERGWHPFLWDGRSMRDLGTLGGGLGYAAWIDDAGDIVGASRTSDGAFHGFLWQHGRMQDLPPVAGAASAFASAVNVRGEVVGDQADANGDSLAPVLWRHGHAYDLSTLTAPTDMRLSEAVYIDGQGDIATLGTLPDGRQRLVELVRHRSVPLPGPPVPTQSTAEAHIAATGALRRALRRADRTGDLARALDLRSRRG